MAENNGKNITRSENRLVCFEPTVEQTLKCYVYVHTDPDNDQAGWHMKEFNRPEDIRGHGPEPTTTEETEAEMNRQPHVYDLLDIAKLLLNKEQPLNWDKVELPTYVKEKDHGIQTETETETET